MGDAVEMPTADFLAVGATAGAGSRKRAESLVDASDIFQRIKAHRGQKAVVRRLLPR